MVRAGEVVPGTTTTQYGQGIRNSQEAFGVTLGPVQTIEVGDGTQAFAWQAAVQLDDGSIVQQRMVALVRDGVGWRITLGGNGETSTRPGSPSRRSWPPGTGTTPSNAGRTPPRPVAWTR